MEGGREGVKGGREGVEGEKEGGRYIEPITHHVGTSSS